LSEAEFEDNTEIDITIKDTDSLPKLLVDWQNIQKVKKELLSNEDKVKTKIKIFLKEKKWDKYLEPNTNITINLIKGQTESFDKQKLRLILSDEQFNEVRKITTYEKLMILTPEDKERLKKIMRPSK